MNEIFLKSNPDGEVLESHFGMRTVPIPAQNSSGFDSELIPNDHILVKILSISVDPYMRSRMSPPGPGYLKAWEAGDTIESTCIAEVKMSRCGKFPNGTLVQGMIPWREYAIIDCSKPFPMGPMEIPKIDALVGKEEMFLGIFGTTGLTAAIGMKVKGGLKKSDVVVVSGAAGATGSVAGQIAKVQGASKVIGICGSDEKCDFIKSIGFTHAINYKTSHIDQKLTEICCGEVNCYFDNVGGETSEAVIKNMKANSNIVLCGQISSYNKKEIPYPNPLPEHLENKVKEDNISRDRFLLLEWMQEYESCLNDLIQWFLEGKLINKETIVHGFDNSGKAFCDMMNGKNIGKMIVKCE